jgi:hypothetical protein
MTGPWRPRPWWMFRSRAPYVRSVYAPANIGGGWDGFEFTYSLSSDEQARG